MLDEVERNEGFKFTIQNSKFKIRRLNQTLAPISLSFSLAATAAPPSTGMQRHHLRWECRGTTFDGNLAAQLVDEQFLLTQGDIDGDFMPHSSAAPP
ncbi:hypothetical protein E3N88_28583 [Mikania micrantha]|uniref:Uncharacterized protein n=1 Tax=Mikania micrantha TaxID=192012 RepID=A0A5N6N2U0_9ASTR|nr:hypothetical protein E3N88_28583 [Mikania micrantha]